MHACIKPELKMSYLCVEALSYICACIEPALKKPYLCVEALSYICASINLH